MIDTLPLSVTVPLPARPMVVMIGDAAFRASFASFDSWTPRRTV
ncbi:hypothetical protein P7B04_25910 [Sphingobium yanoikuyae]|nr:hypothetical protein [Sphingobium yanoikuyae]MDG2516104.1 hypothetical protein [Sphingobium yanoikuyae]